MEILRPSSLFQSQTFTKNAKCLAVSYLRMSASFLETEKASLGVFRRPFTFFRGAGGQMQRTFINHSAPRLLRYGVCGPMQPSIKGGTLVPRKSFEMLLDVVTLSRCT